MRCLVTGADGFIGSHLVEALAIAGHEVTGFCQYNSLGSTGWLDTNMCEVVLGDVRDAGCVMDAVRVYGQDMTFHLAALIGIPYSYKAAQSYIDTNVVGTFNILQAAQLLESPVITTSTSEVYGSCQIAPMSETHPLSAQSPYAATKIAADQLALSFYRSFGTPVTVVRPFNTYGPRQSLRAFVPQIISQCLDGDVLKLGNTDAMRDLTFISDTVAGFLAAMHNGTPGEVYNLGQGSCWKVGKVAELICSLMGKEMTIVQDEARVRPEKSEVDRLICDATKARAELDWAPAVGMVEGLRKTIDWFASNRGKYQQGYVV